MIRAYRAKGHHYLAVADELEKGFTPLPVAETGKAHQHYVSEQRAKLPDPLLEEKLNLASDFSNATVREITYDEAKNMIYANEYLGTMPGGVVGCYGLFFGEYLGAVEVFGSTAGTKVNTQAPGHCVKPKVGFFADFTTVRNRNPGIPSSVEDNLFDFFLTSHVLSRSLRASVRQSPS